MCNQIDELCEKFLIIKNMNWVKSVRHGTDAVGRTFESLLGMEENNLEIADFKGIEIKTKRCFSKSFIRLFNMTPSGKYYHEIERLQSEYGYLDTVSKKYKVLNNSVFCDRRTFIGINYQFMLKIDRENKKVLLCVFDIHGNLIEKDVYWDFDIIEEKLYRKLKVVALVKAHRKFINNIEYFRYYDMKLYILKSFETFITLLERGIIRINFKINVFRSGKRIGQIHDHGTSFEIRECDLLKLYDEYSEGQKISFDYDRFFDLSI